MGTEVERKGNLNSNKLNSLIKSSQIHACTSFLIKNKPLK